MNPSLSTVKQCLGWAQMMLDDCKLWNLFWGWIGNPKTRYAVAEKSLNFFDRVNSAGQEMMMMMKIKRNFFEGPVGG